MQRLEVSGALRPIYGSLGVKRLMNHLLYAIHVTSRPANPKKFCSTRRVLVLL